MTHVDFLASCPPELLVEVERLEDLDAALDALHTRGHAAWPELPVDPAAFARYLGKRLHVATLAAGLEAWHAEDLYLVHAVLQGDPRALQRFDDRMLKPSLRGLRGDAAELGQRVRQKLLTGPKPRLGDYAGRGPLLAWLGIVIRREAIDLARSRADDPPAAANEETSFADLLAVDPELCAVRDQAKHALQAALKKSLEALSTEDRQLLRLHHLEGVAHGELGQRFGLPRSTVAHRLATSRKRLLENVKARLSEDLALRASEADSLIGLARSHLDLSFSVLRRDD